MRFTLRQLEYFVAVCDAGSITEAALRMPVAQSSVSAAIAQLERSLGVQLLIRHHAQGVSPTPAGRMFLPRARALLREADDVGRFASELTIELSGRLDLGCLTTLAPLVTPGLCREFIDRHPDVDVRLVAGDQHALLAGLRSGTLSLVLTYDLQLDADIDFTALASLPPYALLPAGHPLAGRDEVTLAELAGEPLVLLDIPLSRDYFQSLFAAEGLDPRIAHRVEQPDVMRSLVANGYGYAIVNARPRTDRSLDGSPLETVRIAGRPRPMILGVAALSGVRGGRVAEAFREHCRKRVTEHAVPGLRVDDG